MSERTPIEWARALAEALHRALRHSDLPTVKLCSQLVEEFKEYDEKERP
jgi:hypothetical protein